MCPKTFKAACVEDLLYLLPALNFPFYLVKNILLSSLSNVRTSVQSTTLTPRSVRFDMAQASCGTVYVNDVVTTYILVDLGL